MSSDADDLDTRVRAAAFTYLADQRLVHGDVVPRDVLSRGFSFEGTRVPLIGPQGIFKPALLRHAPLSITTSPPVEGKPAPYEDEIGADGLLRYRYRGSKSFSVAVDDRIAIPILGDHVSESREDARRIYVTAAVQRRLHQQAFRERVIEAYQRHCAVCRLRHLALLEAAHILPDGHPRGVPIVANGLSLCKLHHAAFDAHLLGIRPDYVIELRQDILEEADGPMLLHGMQGFHGAQLVVPRVENLKPRREFLEERYAWFKKAG